MVVRQRGQDTIPPHRKNQRALMTFQQQGSGYKGETALWTKTQLAYRIFNKVETIWLV